METQVGRVPQIKKSTISPRSCKHGQQGSCTRKEVIFFKKKWKPCSYNENRKEHRFWQKRESVDTKASKKEEIMVHVAKTFIKAIK